MVAWRELGGPARTIGTAISRAVDAAEQRDVPGYEAAFAELTAVPAEQAGLVLAAVLRSLLEEQHPDGLDSDDIQAVLARCYRGAAGWLPLDRVEPNVLIAVLASSLGIHEPGVTYEEVTAPPKGPAEDWVGDPTGGYVHGGAASAPAGPPASTVPTAAQYAWHAPLLIADLLAAGRRPLGRYLDSAFTEIARVETVEMP